MNPGGRVSAGKAARMASMGNFALGRDRTSGLRTPWDLDCKPLLPGTFETPALRSCKMSSAKPILRCGPRQERILFRRRLECVTWCGHYTLLPAAPCGRHQAQEQTMPVSVTNSRLIYDALKECD